MAQPKYDAVSVLIPGYSVEDLPTDLNEQHASGLLNAIATAWHPALLAVAKGIISFRQAEVTDLPPGRQVILVPECSEDWLGHDWKESLADTESLIISSGADRDSWNAAVLEAVKGSDVLQTGGGDTSAFSHELVADFFSLGIYHLEVMLLSRRMHHFMDPDEYLLEAEAHSAAEALLEGNEENVRDHLRRCFECLQETREQFHPVDSWLVDLCLPSVGDTNDLARVIESAKPLSLCCSAGDLVKMCRDNPQLTDQIRQGICDASLSLVTGHIDEIRTAIGSASSLCDDLSDGLSQLEDLVGDFPRHWGRRRFGLIHSLPEVLAAYGFESALHIALDDGIYPDREYGQLYWQGPGSADIPASSRIPLAIDSAATFLRFPDRFTETMQEDNSAVMFLARLPQTSTPWLEDLRRGAAYAPVLGAFATIDEYVNQTSGQGTGMRYSAGEYLSPALIQSSVLRTESPVSSPAELHRLRLRVDSLSFLKGVIQSLKPNSSTDFELELCNLSSELRQLEVARCDFTGQQSNDDVSTIDSIEERLQLSADRALGQFCHLVPSESSPDTESLFIANTLPFGRQCAIEWPEGRAVPQQNTAIRGAYRQAGQLYLEAEIPAGGFLWLTESYSKPADVVDGAKGQPLAEPFLLRNEFFEILINEATGGIAEVRCHGKRGNRFSQQVSFRYESGKSVTDEDGDEFTTNYAFTRLVDAQVLATGPWQGSIATDCEVVDVASGDVLCRFRQIVSVTRTSPRIDVRIEFENPQSELKGNPWMTYYACRFAWDNEAASITRSLLGQACGFRSERFESPDYIEVADSDQRLLIVPHGRPYHRRSGRRMLDSLLMVEGETERSFQFTVEVDQPYPMKTVQDLLCPAVTLPTQGSRPSGSASAWILGLTGKSVVIARTSVERVATSDVNDSDDGPESNDQFAESTMNLVLLLVETEGQSVNCRIRTARNPGGAYSRRIDGDKIRDLNVGDDGVHVSLSPFQFQEVVLCF